MGDATRRCAHGLRIRTPLRRDTSLTPHLHPAAGGLLRARFQLSSAPDPALAELVRRKARRLSHGPGFAAQDAPDLEQELWVRLWPRLPAHDPAELPQQAFYRLLIARAALNVLRDRAARGGSGGRVGSLRPPGIRGTVPLEKAPEGQLAERRPGGEERLSRDVDHPHDIDALLRPLSPGLRRLAEMLQHQTLSEAARRLGVNRDALRARLRPLRQQFEDYFSDSS